MRITCPQCGFDRSVSDDRIPAGSIIAKCPKCGCRFRFSRQTGVGAILPSQTWRDAEAPSDAEIRDAARQAYEAEASRFNPAAPAPSAGATRLAPPNPWQSAPEPNGWLDAFYQTLLGAALRPAYFFASVKGSSSWGRPLAFFAIISGLQIVIERIWGEIIFAWLGGSGQPDPQLAEFLAALAPGRDLLAVMALRLASMLFQLVIFSALLYAGYRLLAGGKAAFNVIFQILCYSSAPWILCVVPGLGNLAGAVWGVWCLAVGCKTALGLSWAQTWAGFLPLLLVCIPMLAQLFALASQ